MIIPRPNLAILYVITSISLSSKVNSFVQVDHNNYCTIKSSWTALQSDHNMKSSQPCKMGNSKSKNSEPSSQKSEKSAKERLKENYGYEFKEVGGPGVTIMMSTDGSNKIFEFDANEGNRDLNQKRYEAIGEIITELVYERLEHELKLEKVTIPVNARKNDAKGFFFMSPNALDAERLLILIHGSGVVRAGQWARSLIINDSWESGTMEPYIKQAQEQGFGIIITNGNHNFVVGKGVIKGSDNPQDHFVYVWKHFIDKAKAKDIAVVAHSFGGVVVQHLVRNVPESMERIKAVAFTDSVHYLGRNEKNKIREWFRKTTRNWVSSPRPLDEPMTSRRDSSDSEVVSAGTTEHVWTSHMAKDSVFKFINEKLQGNVVDDPKKETASKKDSTTKEKSATATPEIETKKTKIEGEKSNDDGTEITFDTVGKGGLEKGDTENDEKNLKDKSKTEDDDSMNGVENDRKEESDVKNESKNKQETVSSDLDKEEAGNEEKGNKEKENEEIANDEKGNEEKGNEEMANDEKGNKEKGNEEMANDEKGNEEMANDEKGNEEMANDEKGNEEMANDEKGNEEMANDEKRNEENSSKKEETETNDVPVTPV